MARKCFAGTPRPLALLGSTFVWLVAKSTIDAI